MKQGVRNKIKDILARLEEVFAAWAEVLPLLCKVEKLEPNEAMHNLARFNC
jgi:hypothetical protein